MACDRVNPSQNFLFIIVMEALSRKLMALMKGNYISGFSLGASKTDEINLSHLLYVDNNFSLCENDLDNLLCV